MRCTARFLFAALILLVFSNLQAQDHISGALSGTLGPGIYIVDGNCQILPGETLTIEPGTEFLFTGPYAWLIQGTLLAEGNEDNLITFTRQEPTTAHLWGGLQFMSGAPDNSVISYCLIEYGSKLFGNGGGIYSEGVSFQVTNSIIRNCQAYYGGAFHCSMGAVVDFIDCIIQGNEGSSGGGLDYDIGTSGVVENCTIINNYASGT